MRSVDLNADMGESFGAWEMGDDEALLRIVTSANIACGFHAGDPLVMHRTMTAAVQHSVGIGAHPGYQDLWGFGRRPIAGEVPEEVGRSVIYQTGAAQAMARVVGGRVAHMKLHGALANLAMVDRPLAAGIAAAIHALDPAFVVMAMPGSALEAAAVELGLTVAREIYADRAYDDSGNLVSRKLPGAVLHDAEQAAERVARMIGEQAITSISGRKIAVRIDSICVHGDNPAAIAMAAAVRQRIEQAGFAVRPLAAAGL